MLSRKWKLISFAQCVSFPWPRGVLTDDAPAPEQGKPPQAPTTVAFVWYVVGTKLILEAARASPAPSPVSNTVALDALDACMAIF